MGNFHEERVKYFYDHPELLVDIEFANRTNHKKKVWVEPNCIEFEIDAQTEYKILTHDKFFRIEFDEDQLTFYLQYSFGFKLYKRPASKEIKNTLEWELEFDSSDVN
ncbi:hypothetical protein [Desertivirga arenae]|uniref:hypothetical protein n=1 Tax=Desertivirga arenae TaxID=2810309 RepID=UPI001A9570BB|nr:hypothetical protein [Pedobacter sp. SYSU D00823]